MDVGIVTPKPAILVKERSLLQHAYESLGIDATYVFVFLEKQAREYDLINLTKSFAPSAKFVLLDDVTEGPAQTILSAESVIPANSELITVNCDQKMCWNHKPFLKFIDDTKPDGCVITVKTSGKNYSYIALDEFGWGTHLAEKCVISDNGLIGFHYYKKASDCFSSIKEMIVNEQKQQGEYYMSGTYNVMIQHGKKINSYELKLPEKQIILGTPQEVYEYETSVEA